MGLIDQFLELDDDALADAVIAAEAAVRRAQAVKAAAVEAVRQRVEGMGYAISGAAETVAALTQVSSRSATYTMDAATGICERPAVWHALHDGRVDWVKARLVSEALVEVEETDRTRLEAVALEYAAGHTAYQLRQRIARLLVDHCPDVEQRQRERRRAKAWEKRHLGVHARSDGMADLYGYLPQGSAHLLIEALDELAATYPDGRTRDQKRVDALEELLAEKVRVLVRADVVITADVLARLQTTGCSVSGLGPADSDYAAYLALNQDARWRRLVSDPLTGRLQDLSAGTYTIPTRLREAVRARDRRCRFPGCAAPASQCDTDHVQPWPHGPTDASNLGPGCRGHHRVKTHSGWHCQMNPDGSMTWTSPLGTRHTTHPWNYRDPPG